MSAADETIEYLARETPDDKLADALRSNFAEVAAIQEETHPTVLEATIEKVMDDVRRRNTFEGVATDGLPALLQKIEEKQREDLTKAIAARARTVESNIRQQARVLDVKIEHSKTLRPGRQEPIARVAEILEREETRRLLAGKPVRALLKLYERTAESDNPHLVAWLESEIESGFQTLALRTGDPDDHTALLQLNEAHGRRREARVPLRLRETQAELGARWTEITRALIKMLADGRATPARKRSLSGGTGTTAA